MTINTSTCPPAAGPAPQVRAGPEHRPALRLLHPARRPHRRRRTAMPPRPFPRLSPTHTAHHTGPAHASPLQSGALVGDGNFEPCTGPALSQLIDSGSPLPTCRPRAPKRLPRLQDGVPTSCQWHGGASMAVGGRRGHLCPAPKGHTCCPGNAPAQPQLPWRPLWQCNGPTATALSLPSQWGRYTAAAVGP